MEELSGVEVLLVDNDVEVRRGLSEALTRLGLHPTVVERAERAPVLVRERYFPVAIVDVDTPTPSGGIDLCRQIVGESPTTAVFMLTARKSFEVAVAAIRAGASDVVVKEPDQVEYLQQRLADTSGRVQRTTDDATLVRDALAVHQELFAKLMDRSRRVAELDERLGNTASEEPECALLIVETPGEATLFKQLAPIVYDRGYRLRSAGSGGEALDLAGSSKFAIALVESALPDLPGSMVVSAFKGQSPETITALYRLAQGSEPGRADIVDGARTIPWVAAFRTVAELVPHLEELREAARRTGRERRHLAAFREENYELLKRYAELKQRLEAAKRR